MARNDLFRDIHAEEDLDRLMRERSAVDVSDPAPAVSAPAEGDVSDHYRISSPNRIRVSGDNGKMRHHRSR